MRRLSLLLFIFVPLVVGWISFAGSLSAQQSCKVDTIALRAKVEANPSTVLYALGDAIALNPDCIGDLIETAIAAAKPSDDTLTQIIRLSITEYPAKAGTIAESAVLAAPDQVDVIRKAFEPPKKTIVASPVSTEEKNPTPIEKFLASYRTSRPYDPEDVANQAMSAIDNILAKLKNSDDDDDNPVVSKESNPPIGVATVENKEAEEFKFTIPHEEIRITTFRDEDHQDKTDESLPKADPVQIKDPVVEESELVALLAKKIKEKEIARDAAMAATEQQQDDKIFTSAEEEQPEPFHSSVYPIPGNTSEQPDNLAAVQSSGNAPVLRSRTISPTTPRIRISDTKNR